MTLIILSYNPKLKTSKFLGDKIVRLFSTTIATLPIIFLIGLIVVPIRPQSNAVEIKEKARLLQTNY